MPRKTKVPHETPEAFAVPIEKLQEVKLTQKQARALMKKHDDGRAKPRTEAQEAAWQRCVEARNQRFAKMREAKAAAPKVMPSGAVVSADVAEGRVPPGMIRVVVKPKRVVKPKPVPVDPVTPEESATEGVEEAPEPVPVPKKRGGAVRVSKPAPVVYATDTQGEETELTEADVPADVPKRVLVPRRVKQAVQKVRAINQAIQQAAAPVYRGPSMDRFW